MDRIARYLDLGGWSAFCIAMAIVIFAPERMWWSAPLHLLAGILFVVSIVEQRRRARRSCPDEDAAARGRS